jgi:hypothetical protein
VFNWADLQQQREQLYYLRTSFYEITRLDCLADCGPLCREPYCESNAYNWGLVRSLKYDKVYLLYRRSHEVAVLIHLPDDGHTRFTKQFMSAYTSTCALIDLMPMSFIQLQGEMLILSSNVLHIKKPMRIAHTYSVRARGREVQYNNLGNTPHWPARRHILMKLGKEMNKFYQSFRWIPQEIIFGPITTSKIATRHALCSYYRIALDQAYCQSWGRQEDRYDTDPCQKSALSSCDFLSRSALIAAFGRLFNWS